MNNKILVILGPTASGKTALAVELALILNGEVISADSMQIYKGMDIATAKPDENEKKGVPHHLLGIIDQSMPFSVADFVLKAKEAANDIARRGKLPIICGGTGLYIDSFCNNISFCEEKSDPELRRSLNEQYDLSGAEFMYNMLYEIDPKYASDLHPNNKTRIVRGIEIYKLTGKKMSEHLEQSRLKKSEFAFLKIGLNYKNRAELYEKINSRVDTMLAKGLLEEALGVYTSTEIKTAKQAIGCKELFPYFEGKISLESAVDNLKRETRRYAKRQLTWFRRDKSINWIMLDSNTAIEDIINSSKKIIENNKFI